MARPPAEGHQAPPARDADRRSRLGGHLILGVVGLSFVAFVAWGSWALPRQFRSPRGGSPKGAATPAAAANAIREAAPRFAADRAARERCLGLLRTIAPAAQAEALTLALTDDDRAVKRAAAYCAATVAPLAGEAGGPRHRGVDPQRVGLVTTLVTASYAPEAAQAAIHALGRYPCPAATARLIQVVAAPGDDTARVYAAWALETAAEPQAVDALLQCLAVDDGLPGIAAAKVLGRRKDPEAQHACLKLLDQLQPVAEPSGPGERAALCLAYMGDTSAVGPLREAAHRLGDWRTGERMAVAFALCRLRPPDEYDFWLLRYAARRFLPPAPYRPKQKEAWANAIVYLVQIDDQRVLTTLIGATAGARGAYAEALTGAFAVLGYQPAVSPGSGYVLRNLPPEQRPPRWLYSADPPDPPF